MRYNVEYEHTLIVSFETSNATSYMTLATHLDEMGYDHTAFSRDSHLQFPKFNSFWSVTRSQWSDAIFRHVLIFPILS